MEALTMSKILINSMPNGFRDGCTLLLLISYGLRTPSFVDILRFRTTWHVTNATLSQHQSGDGDNLLYVPNRGKTPAKLDRAKLFAASALAANSGYASTRNVKIPEYTRMTLQEKKKRKLACICRFSVSVGFLRTPFQTLPFL